MQELIGFVNDFIERDHQVTLAKWTERDNEKYHVIRESLSPFYGSGVDDGHYRHPQTSEEFFQIKGKQVEEGKLIPCVLFQIKRYRHPKWGRLYRVYLGPNKQYPRAPIYDRNFFIAEIEGELKIISVYWFNRFPKRRWEVYIMDNGLCWNYNSGEKIESLGALEEVRKFQPPDDRHGTLKEYNAE